MNKKRDNVYGRLLIGDREVRMDRITENLHKKFSKNMEFSGERGEEKGVGEIVGFMRKGGGLGELGRKIETFVERGGFLLKTGVFVGFWSRNWEKVGKSREFDDFLKIGENREK